MDKEKPAEKSAGFFCGTKRKFLKKKF